jgi:hypothetical protein
MAMKIWDTDPEAKPKPRVSFDDGTVGTLHSGKQVNGQATALPHFRFMVADDDVAEGLAALFDAKVTHTGVDKENHIEVECFEVDAIEVIFNGPAALSSDLKLWINKKLVHHCDGELFLSPPEKQGLACNCPRSLAERKAAADEYRGPSPSMKMVFRLAGTGSDDTFAYSSGSWKLAEVFDDYQATIAKLGGEAIATLRLELVEFINKRTGKLVSYRKPVLDNIRPYNDAIAE